MKIAFIGLGNMGGPMAANLVKRGHQVTGFDVSDEARNTATANNITVVDSPAAAVAEAEAVVTMLPNGALVQQTYDSIVEAAPAGTLFIDSSTISVSQATKAAETATAKGHRAVDAPVSGGVVGAAAGTLTFMLGAPDDLVETVSEILDPMAGRVVHCGGNGAGQAAKLCNNLILAVSMVGVSEAFALGERLGLSHQALFDVASTSSGSCWALTTNCPVPGPVPTSPANRDYQPGFAAALMNKDLGLAMDAASEVGLNAQVGQLVSQLYTQMTEGESGGKDFSDVINLIRDSSQA